MQICGVLFESFINKKTGKQTDKCQQKNNLIGGGNYLSSGFMAYADIGS